LQSKQLDSTGAFGVAFYFVLKAAKCISLPTENGGGDLFDKVAFFLNSLIRANLFGVHPFTINPDSGWSNLSLRFFPTISGAKIHREQIAKPALQFAGFTSNICLKKYCPTRLFLNDSPPGGCVSGNLIFISNLTIY